MLREYIDGIIEFYDSIDRQADNNFELSDFDKKQIEYLLEMKKEIMTIPREQRLEMFLKQMRGES